MRLDHPASQRGWAIRSRLRVALAGRRSLRWAGGGLVTLALVLIALDMGQYLWAKAAVQQAADVAAHTAATIGGDALTRERMTVVTAARQTLPRWAGVQTDATQVQITCSHPCLRSSPMTVSVTALGRFWIPLGPFAAVRVGAHATRTSQADERRMPTHVPLAALGSATPFPTRTPVPTSAPMVPPATPTATPVVPMSQPELPGDPTPRPEPLPTELAPVAVPTELPALPPPTDVPAPADLTIRTGGATFDAAARTLVFTILAENLGASPADQVRVRMNLADGATVAASTRLFQSDGALITWDLDTLDASTARLIIVVIAVADGQPLTSTVAVFTTSAESRTDNNQARVTTTE